MEVRESVFLGRPVHVPKRLATGNITKQGLFGSLRWMLLLPSMSLWEDVRRLVNLVDWTRRNRVPGTPL